MSVGVVIACKVDTSETGEKTEVVPTEGGGPWGNPPVENEGLTPGSIGPAEN